MIVTEYSGGIPVPLKYQDRIDLHDGYAPYPIATGSLDTCLACGVLVGDCDLHDVTCEQRQKMRRGVSI